MARQDARSANRKGSLQYPDERFRRYRDLRHVALMRNNEECANAMPGFNLAIIFGNHPRTAGIKKAVLLNEVAVSKAC